MSHAAPEIDAAECSPRGGTLKRTFAQLRSALAQAQPLVAPDAESAGGWTSERVYTDGDRYFTALAADLLAARSWLTMEMYIVEDDAIGRRFSALLAAAARRGVRVRLLVDGVGAGAWSVGAGRALMHLGVEVRLFHPPPWTVFQAWVPTARRLHDWLGFLRFINRRNHRKVVVIDGAVAWVGSFNLTRVHSRACVGDAVWRDTAARVEGAGVATLGLAFAHAWRQGWRLERGKLRPAATPLFAPLLATLQLLSLQAVDAPVRLNLGFLQRKRLYRDLLARLKHARARVWITNPYFVPRGDLLDALETAVKAGADVRLLLPQKNDIRFMPWVAALFRVRLQHAGVRLHAYQPGMIHAKTILIDDWAVVGSSNLNNRSLRHDLEADVVLRTPAALTALANAFTTDLSASIEFTAETVCPGWCEWLLGNGALVFRRWI